jgi:hypothetical protein
LMKQEVVDSLVTRYAWAGTPPYVICLRQRSSPGRKGVEMRWFNEFRETASAEVRPVIKVN